MALEGMGYPINIETFVRKNENLANLTELKFATFHYIHPVKPIL